MLILSWNIRQGGGSRLHAIVSRISGLNPEILILSEFRNNASGIKLRSRLLDYGYRHQLASNAPSDNNSVLIASKFPFGGFTFYDAALDFPDNVLKADFGFFDLYAVYLPHKKKHKLFEFIREKIKGGNPAIIAGDYNTGINGVDQKGSSFWYEDQLKLLAKEDYADAFRYFWNDAEEYSWYSHQGNGYRYDHTYVHRDILPVVEDCYYIHSWREENISDHSPMVLKLKG